MTILAGLIAENRQDLSSLDFNAEPRQAGERRDPTDRVSYRFRMQPYSVS
jgi:hypothetical protein